MIIAIGINKGGVSKSMTCACLSGIIYRDDGRVLIVDADNQGNVSMAFGINPDDFDLTLYEAITERAHPDECIYRLHGDEPDGPCIDLLPSGDKMALFENHALAGNDFDGRFDHLRRMLARVSSDYDYILIDTPPNVGVTVGNILTAVDGVLVPFYPESFSLRSLVKMLQQVNDFQAVKNGRLKFFGAFPAMVDKTTGFHSEIIEEAKDYAGEVGFTMFKTAIPRSIRVAKSVGRKGQPIVMTRPYDPISLKYRKLWREVLASQKKYAEEPTP